MGYRSLEELGQSMSAAEFTLWYADYLRNPWGEYRDNLHAGLVAMQVTNMAGKQLEKNDRAKFADFILFQEEPEIEYEQPEFTPEMLKQQLGQ